MKKLGTVLLLVTAIFAVAACSKQGAPVKPPAKGSAAPDFTLKDLSGNDTTLSAFRGKVVLLNFWATWCPPCRSEIPSMAGLNARMAGKPFRMLAVSIDQGAAPAVESLFSSMKVRLPALLDPQSRIAAIYGITGVPETFVIDKKGVIIEKVIGPIEWTDPQVIAALDKLIAE